MTLTPKYQMLIRNGKMCWFFPDVTVDDLTKGFLIDIGSPAVEVMKQMWDRYVAAEQVGYFSVFVNVQVNDARIHEILYASYQSLPASQVGVIGMAVPKQSVVVKKRRLTSI